MNVRCLLVVASVVTSTAALASHPVLPILPAQQTTAGTSIAAGGNVSGTEVQLTASSESTTCGSSSYQLEFEVRPVGQAFTGVTTHSSALMNKQTCANQQYPWTTISGLTGGSYKWQVREYVSGTRSGWLQFNAGMTAFTVQAVGASPTTLAFGGQRVGTTSAAMSVDFTNGSTSNVDLTSATVTGPFAISSGPTLPVTLLPGDKVTFGVTSTPVATGAASGTLTLDSTAPNTPHTVALSVTGGYPQLVLSPTTINFGDVGVNAAPATQTVTAQNTGIAPLTISAGNVAAPFGTTGLASLQVPPNDSRTFTVTFAPTAQGPHAATLSIASDDPAGPHSLSLSGTGIAPELSLSQSSIAFADVIVGATSAPSQVTATNSGTGTLNIGTPTLSGPFTTTLTQGTLAQGASRTFDVAFAPTTPGPFTGSVVIPSDDAAGSKTITLSGTARAPALSAAPQTHGFGTVSLGASQTVVVTLSNPGDAALTISSLAFAGTNAADFALQNAPATPLTLAAGGQTPITVVFAPQGIGARSGRLDLTSNAYPAGTVSVTFSGNAEGPVSSVSPTSLNFGTVNVNATSTRTFNVVNSGTAPLTVTGITFGSGAAMDFTTTTPTPFTVAAGSLTTVTLQFKPTAVGSRSATAVVSTSDPINPTRSVALSGSGMAPNVVVSPMNLSFGQVRVGQPQSLSISLQNTGTGPLTVSGIMFSGTDAQRFSTANVGTPFTIQPGTSAATFQVVFTPTSVGSALATLAIASDDPDSPNIQIPLSGEGIAPGISVSTSTLNFGGQLVNRTSAPRTFEISNTGSAPLQVFALSLTGTAAQAYQVQSPVAPVTVPAGGKQAVSVVVTAAQMGEQTARLIIQSDASSTSAHVDLTALGVSELFTVSPSVVDFGTVKVNTPSDPFTVTVQNTGGDPLTMGEAMLQGAGASAFEVQFTPGQVAAQGTSTATVTYRPTAAGSHVAELRLPAADPQLPTAVVTLTGSSVSRVLEASPSSYDFGLVAVGATATQQFSITNKTSKPLTLAKLITSGPEFVPENTGLGTLEPGRTVNISVAFVPTEARLAIGTISVQLEGQTENQVELSIAVTGTGTPAPETKTGCAAAGGSFSLWGLLSLLLPLALRRRRTV